MWRGTYIGRRGGGGEGRNIIGCTFSLLGRCDYHCGGLYKWQLTVYVFISIAVDSYAVEDIILTWLNPDALQIDRKLQIPQYTLVTWQQKHDLSKYSTGNYYSPKGNEAFFFYFFSFFYSLMPCAHDCSFLFSSH